eukprot:12408319-Karenia_brevis.AAC.1
MLSKHVHALFGLVPLSCLEAAVKALQHVLFTLGERTPAQRDFHRGWPHLTIVSSPVSVHS